MDEQGKPLPPEDQAPSETESGDFGYDGGGEGGGQGPGGQFPPLHPEPPPSEDEAREER